MRIAYKWLSEYIKPHLNPEELGEKFRTTSSELESLTDWSEKFRGLIVGKVLEVSKHPQADRLAIALVDIGNEKKRIVCGAPNLAKNQTVIVATDGAVLHPLKGGEITITESVIRGEKSAGMLCSAEEIGLPLPSEGILVIEDTILPGTPASEALHLNDVVLDLEITPNRPDLISYRGLAREVATWEKRQITEPSIYTFDEREPHLSPQITAHIEDSKLCLRYSAICLDSITITSSPLWLQARLLLSGIRPVNNVVDVTNYVMLELGQPLHAFDLDTLTLKNKAVSLKIRSAEPKETISLIDGTEKTLESGDIVIANAENAPIALAGIMGGKGSEITDSTHRILIESATFQGAQIRRTSRRLGLRSEASTRFEKGLDTELTVTAIKRVIFLLKEISTCQVSGALIDLYPKSRRERPRIHLSFDRIQQVLGVHISAAETKTILQHLGFQIPSLTKSSFDVIPPSWRQDINLPEDIMEELIRIWGYDRLPSTLPVGPIKAPEPNQVFRDKQIIRRALASKGMHECIHLTFTSAQGLKKVGIQEEKAVKIPYPLSAETQYLIPSHIIHFLENIAETNQDILDLQLFEIGHLFSPPQKEQEIISLLVRGNGNYESLYQSLKSAITRIIEVISLDRTTLSFQIVDSEIEPYFEAKSTLDILYQEKIIGRMGVISGEVIRGAKIRNGHFVLFASIDLELLLRFPKSSQLYVSPSIFPSSTRDITMVVDRSIAAQKIIDLLAAKVDTAITKDWKIQTIYTGKPLDPEQKSVTIRLTYNAKTRTLEEAEIQKDQSRLITLFRQALSATITE